MKTSVERILTTHVGSLPRPQSVVDYLMQQDIYVTHGYCPSCLDALTEEYGLGRESE